MQDSLVGRGELLAGINPEFLVQTLPQVLEHLVGRGLLPYPS